MLSVLALLIGEALLLSGLWLVFPPLALIAAGLQVTAISLVRESKAAKA
jgi:hypothetical protein